ncbi:MAG: FeoB-associated Cys-rich membrane protein [Flavobacteriaceae bacterium]|nr:FeoB-associated Cys-rich membrane protein [Flavobacteriaceae bacterium]
MNDFFQTLIIASVLVLALLYVFRKQLRKSGKKKDNCGDGDCGC